MGRHRFDNRRHANRHMEDHDHSDRQEVPQRSHVPVNENEVEHMSAQYGREDLPNPKRPRFANVREDVKRVKSHGLVRRVQEWNDRRNAPPTVEEIQRMKLQTEKERLKTEAQGYKSQRRGMLFSSYNAPVSRARSVRKTGVSHRDVRHTGGGIGFGLGNSILRDNGAFGSRRGSYGGFVGSAFGHGLDTMFGSFGSYGRKPMSRTKIRTKSEGYGTNLSKMFGI